MSKLKMPDFATDAEEAAWWFDNQDEIAREYAEEHAAELLGLVMSPEDIEIAVQKAAAKGISPNEYVRDLLHHALHEQAA